MKMHARRVIGFVLLMALMSRSAGFAGTLSAGTLIAGRVQQELSSRTAREGDPFTVRTEEGATIYGHLSDVVPSNASRKAHLTLNFDRIRFPDGSSETIRARLVSVGKHPLNVLALETNSDIDVPRYAQVQIQLTDPLAAH